MHCHTIMGSDLSGDLLFCAHILTTPSLHVPESNSWKLWDPYHHDSCCFSDAPTSQRKFKKLVKVQKCSVNVILLIVINTSLYTVTKNSHLMRNSLYEWCGLYWRLFCCCLAYFLTDFLNIGSKILMHSQTYLKIVRLPTTIQTFLLLYL